jgi:hypothetical protein
MNKTVCIACDDQGQYSVGLEGPEPAAGDGSMPPDAGGGDALSGGDGTQAEQSLMAPAKDLDDALAQARALLEQGQAPDAGALARGFDRVAKGPGAGGFKQGGGM